MIYGLAAILLVALVVVAVLVYRRHQDKADKVIAGGEKIVTEVKEKVSDIINKK